jgi:hypothetical protein
MMWGLLLSCSRGDWKELGRNEVGVEVGVRVVEGGGFQLVEGREGLFEWAQTLDEIGHFEPIAWLLLEWMYTDSLILTIRFLYGWKLHLIYARLRGGFDVILLSGCAELSVVGSVVYSIFKREPRSPLDVRTQNVHLVPLSA